MVRSLQWVIPVEKPEQFLRDLEYTFPVGQDLSCPIFYIQLNNAFSRFGNSIFLDKTPSVRILHVIPLILFAGLLSCKQGQNAPQPISTPILDKAESFFNKDNDSAFYYFNLFATSATDSLEIAIAYTYMGIIQAHAGDNYGGQESLLKSLTYLHEHKEKDRRCLSSNYHELGNICLRLKNYEAAIDYYYKAIKYIERPQDQFIALNGIALTYQKKGAYDLAIDLYKRLLSKSTENKKEYARVLSNYANTKWLKDSSYHAAPELKQALQIRKDSNDSRGLNTSYAHLSDYYLTSQPDSALYYAEKRYEITRQINNPEDEIETLSRLIALSPSKQLKTYFTRYQYLTDSIQTARNAAKNQFALIRYEAEKNKADNLQLQKDNAHKEIQLIVQWFVLILTIIFSIAIGTFIIIRYRRRRKQIETASRQAIQENQLRTSRKVHDVVANGLYRIMTDIQYKDAIDKDLLVDKIENLYEQSRDISYEQPSTSALPFRDKLEDLLTSFASAETKILIVGNSRECWDLVSIHVQLEVEHILQELMINMKKHSQAHNVLVKFERKAGLIHIHYSDDGIGFPSQVKYGNGLQNTENRIYKINGQHTFEHPEKGLKIHISFPIAQLL